MQTEARVSVMMEGGQRALSSAHGGVVSVEGGTRNFAPKKQQSLQQSQIGTVSQLLSGGVAGAFSKTCTAPLARLTILFQVRFLWFLLRIVVAMKLFVSLLSH